MSESKRSNFIERTITGCGLAAIFAVLTYFGGWVMGIAILVCICVSVGEEFTALKASHNVVSWPTWVGFVCGVPLTLLLDARVIPCVILGILLITALVVICREKPEFSDLTMSMLPLLTVALPGLCIVSVSILEPKGLQVVLLMLTFLVPAFGDVFAYLVGSTVGGPKLCPAISPKKTISGAIGGLVGSVLTAMCICLGASLFLSEATRALAPTWWGFLLLGLIGGIAGQIGDLFASLVKRYSGIKDFSNLFPGHGGMMDRLDSILFMAVVVFCYRVLIL